VDCLLIINQSMLEHVEMRISTIVGTVNPEKLKNS
jgi:hypothetical protein